MSETPLSAISGFLDTLGLADPDAEAGLEELVEELLAERSLCASVNSSRHGTLHLVANSENAALLKYETQWLVKQLQARGHTHIEQVRISVRRY